MKITTYIIRFLLALLFIWAGTEKLFLPFDPTEFQTEIVKTDPLFSEFYKLLYDAGYLYFVGVFQFLCGILMVFKRTYLLGSIMFVPLILCLLMTHVFFSQNWLFILFDSVTFCMNLFIIILHATELKATFLKSQDGWI
ncbi:DoxX family membrane protein [Candidatus Poribacteria bacterium]|nr:DoxX family membrane protein [Candidatus Poribacteria bacterium]